MNQISLKIDNFELVQSELRNRWIELEQKSKLSQSTSKVRIYNLLNDVIEEFPELNKFKNSISNYGISQFQLISYLPYSKANFHSDGPVNRYIIPIITNDKCFNLELADGEKSDEYNKRINSFDLMQDSFLYNEAEYINWFKEKNKDNICKVINENECYHIGPKVHAHINFSILHRLVLVFDTETLI